MPVTLFWWAICQNIGPKMTLTHRAKLSVDAKVNIP